MGKFIWENGTKISEANVEINGNIFNVNPAQYEGRTPLSAQNLNTMQDLIYDEIDKYIKALGLNIDTYLNTKNYTQGDLVIHNNTIYECNVNTSTGEFDILDWSIVPILINDEVIKVNPILIKDIYSTEEIKTNKVHTDGKPIYRRVFSYYKIGGTLNKDRVLSAPVTDLEGPTDFSAKIIISGEVRPFPTVSSTGTILQSRWQNNKIYFSGSDSWTMTADDRWFVATLEYTKTTN